MRLTRFPMLFLCFGVFSVWAAPYIPRDDAVVLDRLPIKASDPAGRELRRLRAELLADPRNVETAIRLARLYFDLASAEGDPRYIGYAEAVLRPWTALPDPPGEIVLVRALLRQYRHDFIAAMADLERVLGKDPGNVEAISWQVALHRVQADYTKAREACQRLAATATPLATIACNAAIDSINGKSREAHNLLSAALAHYRAKSIEYQQWVLVRLGEMALRYGDKSLAEKHFKDAIATGYTDGFVLAAYADLLLDANRPAEVMALLSNRESSDVLLLRLALAAHALKSPDAEKHIRALADRVSAAAMRGDRLHLQEEARFELTLRKNPARAVKLAAEDWMVQREPRDARFLMEAALAAGDVAAAQPALAWMDKTGYEDPLYRELASALRKIGQ